MKLTAIAALCAYLGASSAAHAEAKSLSDKEIAQASKICVSGTGDYYGHPSNACWLVYDAAMNRKDFNRALSHARIGCKNYVRADYCLLTSQLAQQRPLGIVNVGATGAYGLGAAMVRAGRMVIAIDIDDGEDGVLRRKLRQAIAW